MKIGLAIAIIVIVLAAIAIAIAKRRRSHSKSVQENHDRPRPERLKKLKELLEQAADGDENAITWLSAPAWLELATSNHLQYEYYEALAKGKVAYSLARVTPYMTAWQTAAGVALGPEVRIELVLALLQSLSPTHNYMGSGPTRLEVYHQLQTSYETLVETLTNLINARLVELGELATSGDVRALNAANTLYNNAIHRKMRHGADNPFRDYMLGAIQRPQEWSQLVCRLIVAPNTHYYDLQSESPFGVAILGAMACSMDDGLPQVALAKQVLASSVSDSARRDAIGAVVWATLLDIVGQYEHSRQAT